MEITTTSSTYADFSTEELETHQRSIAVELERRGVRQFKNYILARIESEEQGTQKYSGVVLLGVPITESGEFVELRQWVTGNPLHDFEEGKRFVSTMQGDFSVSEGFAQSLPI